jgi:hypothetical protein
MALRCGNSRPGNQDRPDQNDAQASIGSLSGEDDYTSRVILNEWMRVRVLENFE